MKISLLKPVIEILNTGSPDNNGSFWGTENKITQPIYKRASFRRAFHKILLFLVTYTSIFRSNESYFHFISIAPTSGDIKKPDYDSLAFYINLSVLYRLTSIYPLYNPVFSSFSSLPSFLIT